MSVRSRIAWLALLTLALAGCSDEGGAGRLDLDTYENPQGTAMLSIAEGMVVGSVAGGRACFWLGSEPGAGDYVKWPEGYYALDNPLRVMNGDGGVVAESGESVHLGGGELPQSGECGGDRYDRVWLASPR